MKLARPDIFHPRIVWAGPRNRVPVGDDGLSAALRHRGLNTRWLSWADPQTVEADLVIVRDIDDYAADLTEFLSWTRSVANLLNPAEAIAWNLEPGHLDDLAARGIAVYDLAGGGAGAESSAPALARAGRTVLVFVAGEPSHAFERHGAVLHPSEPEAAIWTLGMAALSAAADASGVVRNELLYARTEIIGGASSAQCVEVNLVAPDLGWAALDPDARQRAQRRFALGVESACERLGLGPLSHRRP